MELIDPHVTRTTIIILGHVFIDMLVDLQCPPLVFVQNCLWHKITGFSECVTISHLFWLHICPKTALFRPRGYS